MTKSSMLIRVLRIFLVCTLPFLSVPLSAQTAIELREKASKAFEAGNYKEAVAAAQDFMQKFSTDIEAPKVRFLLGVSQYSVGDYAGCAATFANPKDLPEEFDATIKFHLGAANYFLGQYDKAIAALGQVLTSKDAEAKKNLSPYAVYYIGRSHMGKGSKADEAKDKVGAAKEWAEGLKSFTEFTTSFPNHELFIDVATAKATANIFLNKLDAALADLETLRNKPESAGMGDDIDFLTGYVLTQSAQKLLDDFKKEEAEAVITRAKETYARLAKSPNLVMANQAAFQLASLEFAQAQTVRGDAAAYREAMEAAIEAYRSLRSKDEIAASQQKRVDEARKAVTDAGGNRDRVRAAQQALSREQQKLTSVESAPDTAVDGLSRIGDCLLQLQRYDEARIVYRFAGQFGNDEQKKQLSIQKVISFAMQGLPDQAEKNFAEFRSKYPNDPLAENVRFLIGNALMQQAKYDDAIKAFDESLKNFPASRVSGQIPKLKAQCYLALGKADEALKTFDDFIRDAAAGKLKVPPEAVEDAQRLRALALLQMKQVEPAIKAMQELAAASKTPAIQEEASYQVASMLSQAGRFEEAAKAFADFATKFANSPRVMEASYFSAVSLDKAKKPDEAIQRFQSVADKYKDSNFAIGALDKIWNIHLQQGRIEEMIKAQDALIAAYPQSTQAIVTLFERAKYLDEKAKKKDEAAKAFQAVYDFYKKLPPEVLATPNGQKMAEYAAFGLVRGADLQRKDAIALGPFDKLDEAKKAQWKELMTSSQSSLEKAVSEFPQSKTITNALQRLVDVLLLEIKSGTMTLNEAATYLSKLAGSLSDEVAQVQVLIGRASLMFQGGQPEQALVFYDEAFGKITDPKRMAWADYDRYGSILLENKKWDKALEVYGRLADNFPEPRAQAAATYGIGAAAQGKGDLTKAQSSFATLKEKFPWSDKIFDADFGRATALLAEGKYDEGFKVLREVQGSARSSNETKAKCMLALARSLVEMGDKGIKTSETKQAAGKPDLNIYELAHNNAVKIDLFYRASLPQMVPEALYIAAGAKFKQAKSETDPARKKAAEDAAKKLVDLLQRDYPTSPWSDKARNLS
ncbi:MAG: tetratricopeptide repeat protein [Candidatus Methylacidiphilales bacterium]|nr:tetratricopeptide repeat protein [Candidatus Methylacidiphilales bacterium]